MTNSSSDVSGFLEINILNVAWLCVEVLSLRQETLDELKKLLVKALH